MWHKLAKGIANALLSAPLWYPLLPAGAAAMRGEPLEQVEAQFAANLVGFDTKSGKLNSEWVAATAARDAVFVGGGLIARWLSKKVR
jgi:hypothetical protein